MGTSATKGTLPANPPPLPPKPQQLCEPHVYNLDPSLPDYEQPLHKAIPVGSTMALDDFVHEHHKGFPIIAQVSESLYGVCEDRTLMEGQTFTAHFLKKSEVVDVCVLPLGPEVTIPMTSSFRFGVIFNPENDLAKATKAGYRFEAAGDIMSAAVQPTIVCARNSWSGSTDESSVVKGEVLAVLEVVAREGDEEKLLKCMSISKQQQKLLEKDCIGRFTTLPSYTQLRLSEICRYIKFPAQVSIYSNNSSSPVPPALEGRFLTMHGQRISESVVVSARYGNKGQYSSFGIQLGGVSCLMEVLLSVSVDVQMLKCPDEQWDSMIKESRDLFNKFEPSLVEKLVFDLSPVTNLTQLDIFRAIEYNRWEKGVELVKPFFVESIAPSQKDADMTKHDPDYSYPLVTRNPMKEDADSGQSSPDYEEIISLPSSPPDRVKEVSEAEGVQEENKRVLQSLTEHEVLQLLDSLGLGQYKDGFSREQIDGALMVDLDDEILEYELMVQSKLHRLKLMRVINGKQSTRTPQPSPSRLQQSN